ncbi:glycoside hydrolase family 9 protein [Lacticaseibacillus parakribbianus]|uniref:glycoside hydrolase family 9 protein n=1 Tax=Lacticaseibacillus parakribbianus TaxID=2970927 RepID=UPI0021CAF04A|nr:glycoside hydrolase family 9 protein [Lacticaseibacillus parakribbianus]
MKILINQIGYTATAPKVAVVQAASPLAAGAFTLEDAAGRTVYTATLTPVGRVANWHTGYYATADFSTFTGRGRFTLTIGDHHSHRFTIDDGAMDLRLTSALAYWFKGQRADGEWAASDHHAEFAGPRVGPVDVAGGWFDASGDVGVYLSHQSHTSWYNPQQMAFAAYAFYQLSEQLAGADQNYTAVRRRILAEAAYGADSVMRRYVPGRSFLKAVTRQDALATVSEARRVTYELHHSSAQFGAAATADQEPVTDLNYEASFRSGGGTAIAALAIAGRHYYPGTANPAAAYIQTAKNAFAYLKAHNAEVTNDGQFNLVDAYCALLAAVELYKTTAEYGYLRDARSFAQQILDSRADFAGYRWLSVAPDMPFFHPSDEGLPIVALVLYAGIENQPVAKAAALTGASELMATALRLTAAVNNPFAYPRELTKCRPEEPVVPQFFFPHHTAATPWWQGENARLASLACAAYAVAGTSDDPKFGDQLVAFAQAQLDWLAGRNPYDASMIEGFGRNHVQYHFGERLDFLNAPGGIINGITSGLDDEGDIALIRGPQDGIDDNWRWAEQWLPHVAWTLLALGEKNRLHQHRPTE